MPTPHIEANKEDIAEVVLMPGDPLRAKFIADNYLTNVQMINSVRNMYGYTGYYKDKKVTVMGSGMGIPSIGIYAYELYKFYDVKKIIRVGSCGGYDPSLKLYDIILAEQSYSESTFAYALSGYEGHVIESTKELNNHIEEVANKLGIKLYKGTILTSDAFYNEENQLKKAPGELNCIATEMESYGLFHIAKVLNKEASCLLTVVKLFKTGESATSIERERSLVQMIELALESI